MPDTFAAYPTSCCGGNLRLLPVAELSSALNRVVVPVVGTEMVNLADACGRVLAQSVIAAEICHARTAPPWMAMPWRSMTWSREADHLSRHREGNRWASDEPANWTR